MQIRDFGGKSEKEYSHRCTDFRLGVFPTDFHGSKSQINTEFSLLRSSPARRGGVSRLPAFSRLFPTDSHGSKSQMNTDFSFLPSSVSRLPAFSRRSSQKNSLISADFLIELASTSRLPSLSCSVRHFFRLRSPVFRLRSSVTINKEYSVIGKISDNSRNYPLKISIGGIFTILRPLSHPSKIVNAVMAK